MNIVKDMMGFKFMTRFSAQSYYRYIRVVKMMLRHETVLTLVRSVNADDTGPKKSENIPFG